MSLSAEVVDALVAAGCTVEQLAAAVKADLAADEQRLLVKRAKDAARQRKSRSNRPVSRDVTVTPCDNADTSRVPLISVPPVSPKGDTAPQGAKRGRGSRIPDDWLPPSVAELGPEFRKLAEQWTPDSYRTEAAAFQSYWIGESGAKASKSNWKRAWENRVAQIHGKVMRDQRFASGAGPPGSSTDFLTHLVEKDRQRQQVAPA